MDITNTISVPELIWTVLCLIGTVYRIDSIHDAYSSRQAVEYFNGLAEEMRALADNDLRAEVSGLIVKLCFAGIGIIQMALPPNPDPDRTLAQIIIGILAISAIVVMDVNSYFGRRDRMLVRKRLLEDLGPEE